MPIYKIRITWLHSTETLELDTSELPETGAELRTVESWTGETQEHRYTAKVAKLVETEKSISLTLRYDQSLNTGVKNDSWGESTIALDITNGKATGKATWKDDQIVAYDGLARKVVVTQQATETEVLTDELTNDLSEIAHSAPVTERETQILARIGQGKFRADVTRAWKMGERCAVTGIDVPELLIASHILPWRESDHAQRLDPANGLLLATHVDKLFDRHLLSFKKNGDDYLVAFNPRIREVAEKLGVKADARLPVEKLSEPARTQFADYMGRHFERFTAKLEG